MPLCPAIPSVTAEQSFSTLKHIKSYRGSTMGEERLNGLAKLYIHRELTNDDLIENFVTAVTGIF